MAKTWDTLIREIGEWQAETFPDGTEKGRLKHFQEELDEWMADLSNGEEASDTLFLFLAVVNGRNIDLRAEMERKLEINRARTWAKTAEGYSKHVGDEPEVTPDIDWDALPPPYNYAYIRPDAMSTTGFTWFISDVKPNRSVGGYWGIYRGAHTRMWPGDGGVLLRPGVDFRSILRVRPEVLEAEKADQLASNPQ